MLTLVKLPQASGKLPCRALLLKFSSCNCTNNTLYKQDRDFGEGRANRDNTYSMGH